MLGPIAEFIGKVCYAMTMAALNPLKFVGRHLIALLVWLTGVGACIIVVSRALSVLFRVRVC